jgi:sulfur carrier protein
MEGSISCRQIEHWRGGVNVNIQLNGRQQELSADIKTIAQLLASLSLEKRIVIVELNKEIINKTAYAEQSIRNGDKVELIHFVGGG